MPHYLQVSGLTKSYGDTTVVDQATFDLAEGQTLVLLGKSGSGKTTTLRMLNRLVEPTAGTILINGENILGQNPVQLRRKIGYVIQHNGLFPHLTVRENVATVPRLLKWEQRRTTDQINELLDALELPHAEFADRLPRELSGGQQQRVSLARAMVAKPSLILMDEPFGALDPIIRIQSREKFRALAKKQGQTAVIVTHDMEEAVEIGDKVCLMDEGRIIQQGTPKDLVFAPTNQFVESFLGANRFQLELKATLVHEIMAFARAEIGKIAHQNQDLLAVLQPSTGLTEAQKMELLQAFGRMKAARYSTAKR